VTAPRALTADLYSMQFGGRCWMLLILLGSRAVTGVFAAAFGLCGLFEITGEACWTEEGRMVVLASVGATRARFPLLIGGGLPGNQVN
jgi:hypothetical protein